MRHSELDYIIIVQARLTSSRFHSKLLQPISNDKTLIDIFYDRLAKKFGSKIIFAIPDTAENDKLAFHLRLMGAQCVRGDEHNVSSRYVSCLKSYANPYAFVRLTADCPFVDPDVVDKTVRLFFQTGVDYASTTLSRTFPVGIHVEVLKSKILLEFPQDKLSDEEQEHVTPFVYNRDKLYSLLSIECKGQYSNIRLTVDYPDDLRLVTEALRLNPDLYFAPFPQVCEFIEEHKLFHINGSIAKERTIGTPLRRMSREIY